MSLVSNKIKKVFLCKDTKINLKGKTDIILSPEFYWVRVFDIPVKNEFQAKQVLPSLFEDIIENSEKYSFKLVKLQDNKYLCFAYIDQVIIEAMKKAGINLSLLNSIYFSQIECKDYPQFTIFGNSFLYTEDGILVKVPNNLLDNVTDLKENIDKLQLSSNKVDIKLYNNLLTTKQIYSIILASLIIIGINSYKIYDYKKENLKIDDKIKMSKNANKLPNSMLQVDSIISKYKNIYSREVKKREALEYIINNKELKLKTLELKKENLNLSFENLDENKIKSYISKKYNILSTKKDDKIINLRVQI